MPVTKTCAVCEKRLADGRPVLFRGDDLIHAACVGGTPRQPSVSKSEESARPTTGAKQFGRDAA